MLHHEDLGSVVKGKAGLTRVPRVQLSHFARFSPELALYLAFKYFIQNHQLHDAACSIGKGFPPHLVAMFLEMRNQPLKNICFANRHPDYMEREILLQDSKYR